MEALTYTAGVPGIAEMIDNLAFEYAGTHHHERPRFAIISPSCTPLRAPEASIKGMAFGAVALGPFSIKVRLIM